MTAAHIDETQLQTLVAEGLSQAEIAKRSAWRRVCPSVG